MGSSKDASKLRTVLAKTNYPLFCVRAISDRHILVGGGGGEAKTGIPNACEIYELIYDKNNDFAKAILVSKFDTGNFAIMNCCLVGQTKYEFQLCVGGQKGMCNVYNVKMILLDDEPMSSSGSTNNSYEQTQVRHRTFSNASSSSIPSTFRSKRQSSVEEGEAAFGLMSDHVSSVSGDPLFEDVPQKDSNHKKTDCNPPEPYIIPNYKFDFVFDRSFQSDFDTDDPFQKLVRHCPIAISNRLVTAGNDGCIRIWSHPDFKHLTKIQAHQKEVIDLDIHPSGRQLVSISRDLEFKVWSIPGGEPVTSLNHTSSLLIPKNKTKFALFQTAKFVGRACRYGTVEGDPGNVRLFIALNPVVRTKPMLQSYLVKWHVSEDMKQYRVQNIITAGDIILTSLAISDDGRFIAVGNMEGYVDVYIAFSLQRIYRASEAHKFFITGLTFLPSTPESRQLVGTSVDTALVSISVDNTIILHKIPKQVKLEFFGSFLFFVVFMFCLYAAMSYVDL